MKILVDMDRCSGHGRCYTVAPQVFEADEEGYCAARGREVEVLPGLEADAQRGIDNCPEGAIKAV